MKKIFLAAGFLLMAATVTFANGHIDRKERKELRMERREVRKEYRTVRRAEDLIEVSDLTKRQFAQDFSDAKDVYFIKTKNFDEVSFMMDKKRLRAFYDIDSKLVGTTQNKSFADLPENARKKILEKYAGYTIDRVIKFDDNENNDMDMILYGNTFDDADNYFVELKKDNKAVVVKVDLAGYVSFFTDMK
jgi:hypothetical protein